MHSKQVLPISTPEDTRHLAFFVWATGPRWLLLEDTKRTLYKSDGKTTNHLFTLLEGHLKFLGYHLHMHTLHLRRWVPMTKDRVALAIVRMDTPFQPDVWIKDMEELASPRPCIEDTADLRVDVHASFDKIGQIFISEDRRNYLRDPSTLPWQCFTRCYCVTSPHGVISKLYGTADLQGQPPPFFISWILHDGVERFLLPSELAACQGLPNAIVKWLQQREVRDSKCVESFILEWWQILGEATTPHFICATVGSLLKQHGFIQDLDMVIAMATRTATQQPLLNLVAMLPKDEDNEPLPLPAAEDTKVGVALEHGARAAAATSPDKDDNHASVTTPMDVAPELAKHAFKRPASMAPERRARGKQTVTSDCSIKRGATCESHS